jgi:molybdopterin converting factor small subunit
MVQLIRIRLFAGARESCQSDFIDISLTLPTTVAQLKNALVEQSESLRPFVAYARIAIDNEFADDAMLIDANHSQSAFALIPPVSGG